MLVPRGILTQDGSVSVFSLSVNLTFYCPIQCGMVMCYGWSFW